MALNVKYRPMNLGNNKRTGSYDMAADLFGARNNKTILEVHASEPRYKKP